MQAESSDQGHRVQSISIHSADRVIIVLNKFHAKYYIYCKQYDKLNYILVKMTQLFKNQLLYRH